MESEATSDTGWSYDISNIQVTLIWLTTNHLHLLKKFQISDLQPCATFLQTSVQTLLQQTCLWLTSNPGLFNMFYMCLSGVVAELCRMGVLQEQGLRPMIWNYFLTPVK